MKQTGHELLAWRLAAILLKLNCGERLDVNKLAQEFKVNKRTIHRDLQERFAFLPLEKVDGLYSIEVNYLGRITYSDIERFASLAGLNGLFPGFDTQFIRELFDVRLQETMHVHGGSYENLQRRMGDFRALQVAISERRLVRFTYEKPGDAKKVQDVAPYKLINNTGIWYLVAADGEKPKTYTFSKISALFCTEEHYTPDGSILEMLAQDDSVWINEKKTEVILSVSAVAAPYFRRRKLISHQVIEKELETGGLIVSGRFAHPNQILPIVRYWIPQVRIISPEAWQTEMEQELLAYLEA